MKDGCPRKPEEAGECIKRCIRTKEGYQLLPDKYNLWDEGGCRILARSVKKVMGGQVVTVVSRGRAQHYYLYKDGYLIDDDGAIPMKDFPFKYYEKYDETPVALHMGEMESDEIPRDGFVESRLAAFLSRCMKGEI